MEGRSVAVVMKKKNSDMPFCVRSDFRFSLVLPFRPNIIVLFGWCLRSRHYELAVSILGNVVRC